MMKVAFVTFGCRLNKAEALAEEARLRAAGHEIVDLRGGASPDKIVMRGCSVTAAAQHESEKMVASLRSRFPTAEVLGAGCLEGASRDAADATSGPIPMGTSRAWLKVQDGCSGRCTYCIVPRFRGAPVSVPFERAVSRAGEFFEAGFREIVLTGCNLSIYRSGGKGLPELVDAIAGRFPDARIRLGSIEPGFADLELVDAMAAHANVCRYLHMSLQSASDSVLERMARPYRAARMELLVEAARSRLGNEAGLGADVICGFPGETEQEFAATRSFLSKWGFPHLHAFPYSERPGTPAAAASPSVPVAERRARASLLAEEAAARRAEFSASFVGRNVDVCVEKSGRAGWTGEYLRCSLVEPAPRRSLVRVRVSGVTPEGALRAAKRF